METWKLKQRGRQNNSSDTILPLTGDTTHTASDHKSSEKSDTSSTGTLSGEFNDSVIPAAKSYKAYPNYNDKHDYSSTSRMDQVWVSPNQLDNELWYKGDYWISTLLTLASLLTRLWRIGRRPNVTWDEAHFGKFGAYYINHTFYHDVHPPLAKMLVALAEVVAGHNGTFTFKSGKHYPAFVNYTLIRAQISLFGIALVPIAYLTCIQLHLSRSMAVLAAVFVLFDNALCVMSRFILLDEPLLFFTAMTLLSAAHFQNERKHGVAYSRRWWGWLLMTGISLGCVISSKWVGLFCVILIGLATLEDLFVKYCNGMPWRRYMTHWAARAIALILVPLVVYSICFKIHFSILYKRGSADFKMPPDFQATLKGNRLNSQPYDISYGSAVEIRSLYNGPGLLYSHKDLYPSGSNMQLVTCYSHRNNNSEWLIQKPFGQDTDYSTGPIEILHDGDTVQLVHNITGVALRASKGVLAPITKHHFEVEAANRTTSGEPLTDWKIEVVKQKSWYSRRRIHAMTTVFRLRHAMTGCILRVGPNRLPEWNTRQYEISCMPDSTGKKNVRSNDVLWYIEHNTNKRMENDDLSKHVRSNFFIDMIHLNIEMGKSNSALRPNRDKYNHIESDPWSWPFLIYPMRMGGWGDKSIKHYEIGNPFLWWASAALCCLYPFRLLYWLLRWKRQFADWHSGEFVEFWDNSKLLWVGWALHYLPFFLMGRVTYLHHYLPALYFALLLLAFDLDFFFTRWKHGRYLKTAAWSIGITVFLTFLYFSPFTYGWDRPAKELSGRRWLKTWYIYESPYDM